MHTVFITYANAGTVLLFIRYSFVPTCLPLSSCSSVRVSITSTLVVLLQTPDPWNDSESFSILLSPFSPGLWVVILLMFIAVSVLFYVIGRFSPYEDHAFVGKAATYEGLTLINSFLYVFSSLTFQGSYLYTALSPSKVLIFTQLPHLYTAPSSSKVLIFTQLPHLPRFLSLHSSLTFQGSYLYTALSPPKVPIFYTDPSPSKM